MRLLLDVVCHPQTKLKCLTFNFMVLINLSLHSVVGWFVSGLGLKMPQPAIPAKDDAEVSLGINERFFLPSPHP